MSFLGNNVKVHFAGSDGADSYHAALLAAGVRYRLYSCFPYIDNKDIQDNFELSDNSIIKLQDREMKHVIQDSGLFTLMFGAGKTRKIDHSYILNWQNKLIKFVQQNKLQCTVVECDCQKLLGVEEAWFFRKKLKEQLSNRQINVFHWEDGKEGFDKLIDFSDYIAISVPELRIVKPKQYQKIAIELAKYAKAKKPTIDIHMLGCTEYRMLKDISFCTTADSTSWLSGVRYGFFNDGKKQAHIGKFKKEIVNERSKQVSEILKKYRQSASDSVLLTAVNASLCATICKRRYAELAGNQD